MSVLGLSERQVWRLLARYKAGGGGALVHRGRGRPSNRRLGDEVQAKGRVERVNRTLQDRLVKELRLAGVSGIEAGNAFLPGFIEHFNARFALPPARPDDLHRPLTMAPDRLRQVLQPKAAPTDSPTLPQPLTLLPGRNTINA